MHAAILGYGQCIVILLRFGALVNKKDKDNMTALIFAAKFGNLNCTRLLMEGGANTG